MSSPSDIVPEDNADVLIWVQRSPETAYYNTKVLESWLEWLSKQHDARSSKKTVVKLVPLASDGEFDDSLKGDSSSSYVDDLMRKFGERLDFQIGGAFDPEQDCVRSDTRDEADPGMCVANCRSPEFCKDKRLLLFIPGEGDDAYPCFGSWEGSQEAEDNSFIIRRENLTDFPVLQNVFQDRRYCGICPQCLEWAGAETAPCYGKGAVLAPSVLQGQTNSFYIHTSGCPFFNPSLMELVSWGRQYLQKRLWEEDFRLGRVFLGAKNQKEAEEKLGLIWPDTDLLYDRNLLYRPGQGGRLEQYPVGRDAIASEKVVPFCFLRQAVDSETENSQKKKDDDRVLLSRVFIPPITKFMEETRQYSTYLVSIIFVSRGTKDIFSYRSLLSGSENDLFGLGESGYKFEHFCKLWRWPDAGDTEVQWDKICANLSSCICKKEKGGSYKRTPYVLNFSNNKISGYQNNLLVFDFSNVKERLGDLYNRGEIVRECVRQHCNSTSDTYSQLKNLFLSDQDDTRDLLKVFEDVDSFLKHVVKLEQGKLLEDLDDASKNKMVRQLANYFIWLFSLFPDAEKNLGSVQGFQVGFPSTVKKAPAQAVVFSGKPLSEQAGTQFQLLLEALMMPIEEIHIEEERIQSLQREERIMQQHVRLWNNAVHSLRNMIARPLESVISSIAKSGNIESDARSFCKQLIKRKHVHVDESEMLNDFEFLAKNLYGNARLLGRELGECGPVMTYVQYSMTYFNFEATNRPEPPRIISSFDVIIDVLTRIFMKKSVVRLEERQLYPSQQSVLRLKFDTHLANASKFALRECAFCEIIRTMVANFESHALRDEGASDGLLYFFSREDFWKQRILFIYQENLIGNGHSEHSESSNIDLRSNLIKTLSINYVRTGKSEEEWGRRAEEYACDFLRQNLNDDEADSIKVWKSGYVEHDQYISHGEEGANAEKCRAVYMVGGKNLKEKGNIWRSIAILQLPFEEEQKTETSILSELFVDG